MPPVFDQLLFAIAQEMHVVTWNEVISKDVDSTHICHHLFVGSSWATGDKMHR